MYNMSGDSKCRGKNLNEPGTETCRGDWECYSFIDSGQGKHAKVRCGKWGASHMDLWKKDLLGRGNTNPHALSCKCIYCVQGTARKLRVAPVWLEWLETKLKTRRRKGEAISYEALLIIGRTWVLIQGWMESHSISEYWTEGRRCWPTFS